MKNVKEPKRVTRNGENLLIVPAGMTGKELKKWKKENPLPTKKGAIKETTNKINSKKRKVAVSLASIDGGKDYYIFEVGKNILFAGNEAKIVGFSDNDFVFVKDKKGVVHNFPLENIFCV